MIYSCFPENNMNCCGVPLILATELIIQIYITYPQFVPAVDFIFFLENTLYIRRLTQPISWEVWGLTESQSPMKREPHNLIIPRNLPHIQNRHIFFRIRIPIHQIPNSHQLKPLLPLLLLQQGLNIASYIIVHAIV